MQLFLMSQKQPCYSRSTHALKVKMWKGSLIYPALTPPTCKTGCFFFKVGVSLDVNATDLTPAASWDASLFPAGPRTASNFLLFRGLSWISSLSSCKLTDRQTERHQRKFAQKNYKHQRTACYNEFTSLEDSSSDSPLDKSPRGGGGGGGAGEASGGRAGGNGGVGRAGRNGAGKFILFMRCSTWQYYAFGTNV